MKIKNKIESLNMIKELGLNQFPEIFLDRFDKEKINNFLLDNKAEYYAVRDKNICASSKHRTVKFDEVIDYCKESELKKFTVNVSSYNYRANQVCVGEIIICDDTVNYIISSNPNYTTRDCIRNPDYNGTANIFDKKLKFIRGFEEIADYIFKHNLLNVIVEFSVFNRPVGLNNEKIIIWELRTDY